MILERYTGPVWAGARVLVGRFMPNDPSVLTGRVRVKFKDEIEVGVRLRNPHLCRPGHGMSCWTNIAPDEGSVWIPLEFLYAVPESP